jgi:hypothetical protein
MPRLCRTLRLVFMTITVAAAAQRCIAQQKIPDAEKSLFDSLNYERSVKGLPLAKWDVGLARAARKHAELMAEENIVAHQLPGEATLVRRAQDAGTSFSFITENIGRAEFVKDFHPGWMNSPGHRANILDSGVDSVGIAVVEGAEDLFAVEDFALSAAPHSVSLEEQEKQIERLLAARGLRVLHGENDAQRSCSLDRDYMGTSRPRYVAHYETPNLSKMPEDLDKELRSRRYKSAAVAACASKELIGASFRVVVLLYDVNRASNPLNEGDLISKPQ